jgi:hypothetical protein
MKTILTVIVAALLLSCTKSQPLSEVKDEWVKQFIQTHPGTRPSSLIPGNSDASTQEYEFNYYPPNEKKTQTIALKFRKTNGTWKLQSETQKAE